ncbi:OpgC domain-containing protein [Arthrobacter sp. NicSoilB8]|uniref:OpgC domain-containing protein n=1 Tax=Arthrobacter sp. NicSoilB8 TaxID=2830998 RepID=UPI001CC801AE|nr:OpgC domain-containing protein [Arthrobacter sp. NicSoilB8]
MQPREDGVVGYFHTDPRQWDAAGSGVATIATVNLRRALPVLLVLLVLVFAFTAAFGASAQASGPIPHVGVSEATDRGPSAQDGKGPLWGVQLDWSTDSAAQYAGRLGKPAALYAHELSLPVQEQEEVFIPQFLEQAESEGADALITVNPRVPLAQVDAVTSTDLAQKIKEMAGGFKGQLFIRFAPNMNAGWAAWGQRPAEYVAAFRAVTAAMRATLEKPLMVWSPFQGSDYPFPKAPDAAQPGSPGFSALDTNSDGAWNLEDAAYSPYYPGDGAVDWVGLSAFHDDTAGGPPVNTLPAEGGLARMLGPAQPAQPAVDLNFYDGYSVSRNKPLLLETGAFYSPASGGPSEADIKGAWMSQVLATPGSGYKNVRAVLWNETVRRRASGEVAIDWRLTADAGTASILANGLEESNFQTGPATATAAGGGANSPSGGVISGGWAWVAAAAGLTLAAALWMLPVRWSAGRSWAYREEDFRDRRVDMLRGMAILFVVVNHVGLTSLFQLLTQETIGAVSGAEFFVLLSGAVLGMVYGPKIKANPAEVLDKTSRRSWKLYLTALTVVMTVFFISLVPLVQSSVLTAFTDQGTGAAGAAASGRSYDLYAEVEGLLHFPVPAWLIPKILLLEFGPWQFNIMGLYVVLLLLSPLILWALSRRLAWLVLLVSAALYAVGSVSRVRLLPSQFEDSFPLMVWQVLFVLGLTAGYYRRPLVAWFCRHKSVLALCALLAVLFALFALSNPYLSNAYDVRLALLPDALHQTLYSGYFGRTYLGAGRLLNVLVVIITAYSLLTAYWKLLERALGWFLIPLGQATLYVFIIHVFLILALANIPVLQQGNVWLNTGAYVLVLGLVWTMIKTKFLFRIIPR